MTGGPASIIKNTDLTSDLHGVPEAISPQDGMFEGDAAHYFSVGRSALQCIRLALLAGRKEHVASVLDFGCGFGRVLRVLKAAFPEARLTACDLSQDAIGFCERTFRAEPVKSSEDIDQIRIQGSYDLIWCGTLLTNVDAEHLRDLLALFRSLLQSGGVLVFTTHGPFVARRLRSRSHDYGLDPALIPRLVKEYDETGFGYLDYPQDVRSRLGVRRYGISISRPSWVIAQLERLPDAQILSYTEKAWDNHQDSVAIQRVDP
jgi:SAM-dependent methyltransferase